MTDNKRKTRNTICIHIVKAHRAGKLLEWQATPEFAELCATMQANKITRKSIYTTIEMLFYNLLPEQDIKYFTIFVIHFYHKTERSVK